MTASEKDKANSLVKQNNRESGQSEGDIKGCGHTEDAQFSSVDELSKASSRYEALIAASNTGAWEYQDDSGFVWCSPEYFSMLGYSIEDFKLPGSYGIEQVWIDLVHPDDREDAMCCFADYLKDPKGMYEQYFRMQHRDGQWLWIWSRGKKLLDKEGKPTNIMVGTHIDITEHRQAEERLAISEQQLRAILQASPVGIGRVKERTIEWVNDKMCQISGYGPEEFQHRNSLFLYEDEAEYERVGNVLYKEGLVETKWVRKDGEVRDISIYATQTSSYAYIFAVMDITERKRVEEALIENERKFRTLFDTANDAIFIMKDYIIVDCNRKTLDMFCCSKEDIVGRSPIDFSPEIQPCGIISSKKGNKVMRIAMKGVPQYFEWKHLRLNGTDFDAETSLNSIELGGDTYLQSIVRDVTARKLAEEEVLREREKLQTLSDNAPFGMVLIDKEGRFTYINSRFTELFGYDLSDVPDGSVWFRKAYPDAEYRHSVISAWVEDFKDARPGERKPRAFTMTCKDGTQKIMEFIPSRLTSGDYLMTCEDITEMVRLESQYRQAQKMESIGTLAGGIAHDFNNILTSLMGYTTLMQMKMDKGSPLRSYVKQILSASQKAADLTRNLLAFSRQQPVNLATIDLNNSIITTEKLLRRLLTEDIELRTLLTKESTVVMADKSQMDQILFNLVTNARDAMPKGGVLIIETDVADMDDGFVNAHGFGKRGKYVVMSVSDTGEGMDETTREKIFDPFFTTKEQGKGTGLGLPTVYGIVKQHNGYITVYSEPRHGTTFRIYLPAVRMKISREKIGRTPIVSGSETVLIAEDNEEVRCFVKEALQEHGYKTIEAVDGEDAVERFKQYRDVDLIILDSVMPKKNGREVYEEIRLIDPDIKVIFTSGYTKDVVLNKGIGVGEVNFIAKPFLINMLLQKIREVLDR